MPVRALRVRMEGRRRRGTFWKSHACTARRADRGRRQVRLSHRLCNYWVKFKACFTFSSIILQGIRNPRLHILGEEMSAPHAVPLIHRSPPPCLGQVALHGQQTCPAHSRAPAPVASLCAGMPVGPIRSAEQRVGRWRSTSRVCNRVRRRAARPEPARKRTPRPPFTLA